MTKRIISTYVGDRYAVLATALAASARHHCPEWQQEIVRMPEVPGRSEWAMHQDRLVRYLEAVTEANEGDGLLLIDTDTVIVRSIDDVWDQPFDLACTTHRYEDCPWPVNTGVLFVRASDTVVSFIEDWLAASRSIGTDESTPAWQKAVAQFGAPDQCAFWRTLQAPQHRLLVRSLPCREWNCTDPEWEYFNASTRILHVKGALRKAVFGVESNGRRSASVPKLLATWRQFAGEAA